MFIQTEDTPNPQSMKFLPGQPVLGQGALGVDFPTIEAAAASPLAATLFETDGVMGVYLGASTKIFNRETGAVTYGEVPPYSVVVAGSMPSDKGGPNLYCAVIVKQVDEKTRSKTSVNELLRD